MKVAFIGLGNMGSGIAQRIAAGGFDLTVWNRTQSKMTPLVERGATPAASAREAVADADVVFTSLMDDQSIFGILQAEDGILAGMKPGAIHVCVTTISPDCADRLARLHEEHGSHYVSGPVVGRPDAAASGQLMTYLAGAADAIAKATPVCESYAKQVIAISDTPRIANCMKLCINFNAVALIELMGESYVLAEKCGIPLEHLRDFYQQSAFAHPAFKMYAEKLRARDFAGRGGFVMKGGLKDVRLMLSTAGSVGIDLEIGRIVERKLDAGISAGMEETDWSAFYEITRREAGLG
ncbi:NAD(P)-dependent oxidoreductase [Thauera sp. SDU_THAU2]|uniref:NAD(P)-dependent oxidoreductase n=1 Tax=Thauera sp. SDU_THAU2 TaxID=3136633 RepID=UPI00311FF9F5